MADQEPNRDMDADPEPDIENEPIGPHRMVVLLVDDQAIIGEAVRRLLVGEPHLDYHFCGDPTKAVELAIALQPTVILQDLVMPDVDGLDLVKAYRSNPSIEHVPVIVLSTKEEPAVKKQAFELGAHDYLVKLPDPVELVARIRHHSMAYLSRLQRDAAMSALAQALREKNEFMRIASHDLKNPLTVVLTVATLLDRRAERGFDPADLEENRKLIQTVARQADQMRRLIEDYLDAQAIEDGQLQLLCLPNNLNQVARDAAGDLENYAESKTTAVEVELDESALSVPFDQTRIMQVAVNLTSNAIKFSPPGSRVRIRTRMTEELPEDQSGASKHPLVFGSTGCGPAAGLAGRGTGSGAAAGTGAGAGVLSTPSRYVVFEVSDQGPGLEPKDFGKLFGRYAKLSAKPTGNEKSTGLGLSICRRLVEIHGGRIGARNNGPGNPGQGSPGQGNTGATFWFALPAE